jgi:competence protein ComFC
MTSHSVVDGVIDLLFPKRCVQCGAAGGWLFEPCAGGLRPLPAQCCPRCGAPGPWTPSGRAGRRLRAAARSRTLGRAGYAAGPNASPGGPVVCDSNSASLRARAGGRRCVECAGRDLAFVSAAAAFTYDGPARSLVTACKFRALRAVAAEMAQLAGPAFVAASTSRALAGRRPAVLVTWVPGHRERSFARGFNQAELLAVQLARAAGLPYAPLLRRVRHGVRQSGLDRSARAANVHQAFALREDANRVLKKLKRVVVVDDVYTTGETLNHCAEVLAHADLEPHVFTFARTVRATSSQASLDHAVQKERCR